MIELFAIPLLLSMLADAIQPISHPVRLSPARRRRFDELADSLARALSLMRATSDCIMARDLALWAAENRVTYLGCGSSRLVLRVDEGALKLSLSPAWRSIENRHEILIWQTAPEEVRALLMPVLAWDSGGRWLLMEAADWTGGDLDETDKERLHDRGIHDIGSTNVSGDGRVIDYALIDRKTWSAMLEEQPVDPTLNPAFRFWFRGSKAVDDAGRPLVMYRGMRRVPAEDGYFRMTNDRATLSFTPDAGVANVYATELPASGFSLAKKGQSSFSVMPVYLSIKRPLDLRWYGEKISLVDLVLELGWDTEGGGGSFLLENLIDLIDGWDDLAVKTMARFEIDADDGDGFQISTFEELGDRLTELDSEEILELLAGVTVDAYLIADSEESVRVISGLGYDGIVHIDAFEVGEALYEGEVPAGGLEVETWRPFRQAQVKSAIANRGTFDPEDHRIDYGRG